MKLHNLKIKKEYFKQVFLGTKTFELRKDDRDYEVGDLIHFLDVEGEDFYYGLGNLYQITYILKGVSEYGLQEGYAILGIRPVKFVDNCQK